MKVVVVYENSIWKCMTTLMHRCQWTLKIVNRRGELGTPVKLFSSFVAECALIQLESHYRMYIVKYWKDLLWNFQESCQPFFFTRISRLPSEQTYFLNLNRPLNVPYWTHFNQHGIVAKPNGPVKCDGIARILVSRSKHKIMGKNYSNQNYQSKIVHWL